ncbi:MAG: CRTAC1 family protein [Acidimicrobiia bacterium]
MEEAAAPAGTRKTTGRGWWLGAGALSGAVLTVTLALVATAIFVPAPAVAGPAPHFVEEAQAAGLVHTYDGDFIFFVGGGVAVFDCNNDGKPDAYFAGGSNPAALFRNDSPVGGDLHFEPVPQSSTDLTRVTGAYPIDIDSDGFVDLAVLRVGENMILRGTGNCQFERANESWGIDGGDAWTAAFSATWEGDETLPTLAFGNYLELDDQDKSTGVCSDHAFIRPDGATAYGSPIALSPGFCSLSILFSDWDRTGSADLRMTNDRHYYRDGEDQLWRVVPGETPRPYTHDEGWQQMRIWGMGIASQDLTGDGRPEVFLTSQGDNKLQTLSTGADTPTYDDMALEVGATATRPFTGDVTLPSTAWHAEFQDVNNDGFMDLYVSKGNVEATPGYAAADPNDLLLGDPGGSFHEVAQTAGIVNFARTRGAALADFNLDGLLDLVEVNRRQNVTLWRNVGSDMADSPMGDWVAIQLRQSGANRDGVGSWIEVDAAGRVVQREVTIGGGHASGELGWIHFGLGNADTARIRVQWPDGEKGPWLTVTANQFAVIDRDATAPQIWEPGTVAP